VRCISFRASSLSISAGVSPAVATEISSGLTTLPALVHNSILLKAFQILGASCTPRQLRGV
jgi:hypothetical protein